MLTAWLGVTDGIPNIDVIQGINTSFVNLIRTVNLDGEGILFSHSPGAT